MICQQLDFVSNSNFRKAIAAATSFEGNLSDLLINSHHPDLSLVVKLSSLFDSYFDSLCQILHMIKLYLKILTKVADFYHFEDLIKVLDSFDLELWD